MFYEFPRIEYLSDVLPAIEGRDEFIVARRDWGHVVNYMVNFADTFPDPNTAPDERTARNWAIRRECRGLIFDNSRRIIRRNFFKFFNIGEREETAIYNLDFSKEHWVDVKLDGSLISPFLVNGEIFWGTKMADPNFHNAVKTFVQKSNIDYIGFCYNLLNNGYTPMFEWTGPKNKIVINYNEEKLTLLAVRHMITGKFSVLA